MIERTEEELKSMADDVIKLNTRRRSMPPCFPLDLLENQAELVKILRSGEHPDTKNN